MHISEGRDEEKPVERFGARKAQRADSAPNGTEGTTSRNPCMDAFNQLQSMHGIREPTLERRYQCQLMCAVQKTPPEALTRSNLCATAPQSRSVPGYIETDCSLSNNKSKEASARVSICK